MVLSQLVQGARLEGLPMPRRHDAFAHSEQLSGSYEPRYFGRALVGGDAGAFQQGCGRQWATAGQRRQQ